MGEDNDQEVSCQVGTRVLRVRAGSQRQPQRIRAALLQQLRSGHAGCALLVHLLAGLLILAVLIPATGTGAGDRLFPVPRLAIRRSRVFRSCSCGDARKHVPSETSSTASEVIQSRNPSRKHCESHACAEGRRARLCDYRCGSARGQPLEFVAVVPVCFARDTTSRGTRINPQPHRSRPNAARSCTRPLCHASRRLDCAVVARGIDDDRIIKWHWPRMEPRRSALDGIRRR